MSAGADHGADGKVLECIAAVKKVSRCGDGCCINRVWKGAGLPPTWLWKRHIFGSRAQPSSSHPGLCQAGMRCGLALRPGTAAEAAIPYVEAGGLDLVLVLRRAAENPEGWRSGGLVSGPVCLT